MTDPDRELASLRNENSHLRLLEAIRQRELEKEREIERLREENEKMRYRLTR